MEGLGVSAAGLLLVFAPWRANIYQAASRIKDQEATLPVELVARFLDDSCAHGHCLLVKLVNIRNDESDVHTGGRGLESLGNEFMIPLDDSKLEFLRARTAQLNVPITVVIDCETEQLNVEVAAGGEIIRADVG